ncbi:MAG: hypothetical protein K0Q99_2273 [Clostridia bacterium]|nr:hypothetical protein [Clostridia bacterium]
MLDNASVSNNSHKKYATILLTLLRFVDIMDIVLTRRDVRAVYGTGLENQRRVKASEGSNPSLSEEAPLLRV